MTTRRTAQSAAYRPINRREMLRSGAAGAVALLSTPVFSPATRTHAMEPATPSRPAATGFIYDDRYLQHVIYAQHPESPERLRAVIRRLTGAGLIDHLTALPLLDDAASYLPLVHTAEHIRRIRAIPLSGKIAELSVAGALGGVRAVCEGSVTNAFCAIRPPGHHATDTGREEGFCYFNNIAIAARYAQKVHGIGRVLIIDWDFHHGNGTESAFYDDPTVLFFSTHNQRYYPGTGSPQHRGKGPGLGFNINVHLGCGAGDDEIFAAWREHLFPAVDAFKPELVLISAGFDSRQDDPLGCFDITDEGYTRLTREAMRLAREHCGGRLVSILEGGYNTEGLASAVETHVRTLLDG